jgi:hypothetical protein
MFIFIVHSKMDKIFDYIQFVYFVVLNTQFFQNCTFKNKQHTVLIDLRNFDEYFLLIVSP